MQALPDRPDDRWAWRRRVRSNPAAHRLYRTVVALVGLLVVAVGLVAVPAPGPGWLIVFVGVSILASEFEWAQRLLLWGRQRLGAWNDWLQMEPLWVRGLVALGTAALVIGIFWGFLAWAGPPGWLPHPVKTWLALVPGVQPG